MKGLVALWRKLTQTKAIDNFSSELENAFFESAYRVSYLIGLSTVNEGFWYQIYSNVVKLSVVLLVCGEIWYTLTIASTLDETVGSANCIVLYFITFYRYSKMLNGLKRKKLSEHAWNKSSIKNTKLLRQIAIASIVLSTTGIITLKSVYKKQGMILSSFLDITTNRRKKIVAYWANTNDRYLKLLLGIGNLTLFAWYLFPLVDDIEYNLVVDIRLPFSYSSPRIYFFAYILVIVVFCYVSHCVMATDLNLQAYLLHLICQFNVLADCFENLVEDCTLDTKSLQLLKQTGLKDNKKLEEKYKKRLGVLVKQHNNLLKVVLELRSILSGPMLGQLAGSGTLICFIGYQAATTLGESLTKGLMSFFFLGYNLTVFYIICRWCEEITTQSQNIGMSAYCCGWESGLSVIPTIRSSLMLVIARANKPLILTAGGMYNLSLVSFTNLVKTSYSALTVLLRFKQN